MQSNKLRMAIRATAAVAVLGMAGPVSAVSFDAGGWDTSVYGYARLNASYDIDEDVAASTQGADFSKINVGAAEKDEATGHFGMDAVQSRIGVKTSNEQGVTFNIEGDFRGGGANGGELRLRHAYGSYNGILAGQTWSNYNSFVGNTTTLDFDSLPGTAGYQSRTAQLRYTTGPFSVSVEDPKNSGAAAVAQKGTTAQTQPVFDSGGGALLDGNGDPITSPVFGTDGNVIMLPSGKLTAGAIKSKDSLPVFTARLEDSNGGFSYSAALLAQQVGYDSGTRDDSAFGFATFVAGKLALNDMFSVQGTFSYGDGASSYIYRSGAPSAFVKANGDLETIKAYGGSVGVGMKLDKDRSINVGYGFATSDWDDVEKEITAGNAADNTETNSMATANYIWTPINNVMMGIEYAYVKRETVGGDDGDANRLMFSAQYSF